MNELGMSWERDRYELFWYSQSNVVNDLGMSWERDRHELCWTKIKVHAQLKIHLNRLFVRRDKLDMSCK
jgi:hypothetical protein